MGLAIDVVRFEVTAAASGDRRACNLPRRALEMCVGVAKNSSGTSGPVRICGLKQVLKTEFKLSPSQLGGSKFHFPGIISRGDYFSRLRCAILLFHFQPLITSKLSAMDKPMSPTSLGKFNCNSLKGHGGSWKGSASWHWNL